MNFGSFPYFWEVHRLHTKKITFIFIRELTPIPTAGMEEQLPQLMGSRVSGAWDILGMSPSGPPNDFQIWELNS
jgi:hypothetical protein